MFDYRPKNCFLIFSIFQPNMNKMFSVSYKCVMLLSCHIDILPLETAHCVSFRLDNKTLMSPCKYYVSNKAESHGRVVKTLDLLLRNCRFELRQDDS